MFYSEVETYILKLKISKSIYYALNKVSEINLHFLQYILLTGWRIFASSIQLLETCRLHKLKTDRTGKKLNDPN